MKTRLALFWVAIGLVGCAQRTPPVESPPPSATADAPSPRASLPYDPAYPRVAVVVEPLRLKPPEQPRQDVPTRIGWSSSGWSLPALAVDDPPCELPVEPEVTLQSALTVDLERAIAAIGNITLIDAEAYAAAREPQRLVPPGHSGLYVIGGTVEEFDERVATQRVPTGPVFGVIGTALSVAGAITGIPALNWSGVGLALVSPAMDLRRTQRSGVVTLSLHLFDNRAGMLVSTFRAAGTTTDVSPLNGFALFGFGSPGPDYGRSLLGRAHQEAFDRATSGTWSQLQRFL